MIAQLLPGEPIGGGWQCSSGKLKQLDSGWLGESVLATLRTLQPLPGLNTLRLKARVSLKPNTELEVRMGGHRFYTGCHPRTNRITLDRWCLDVTSRGTITPDLPCEIICERSEGRLRLVIDGEAVLDCADPRNTMPLADVEIGLPGGCILHEAALNGSPAHPNGQRPKPVRNYDLSICIDFYDDVIARAWTPKTFREAARLHRKHGIKRIYFIDHGGYEGGFFNHTTLSVHEPRVRENLHNTYQESGEFLNAMVQAGHAEGLEVYAIVKPYETGLTSVLPADSARAAEHGGVPHIGGIQPWVDRFTASNWQLRVERDLSPLPDDLDQRRFGALRLTPELNTGRDFDPGRLQLWTSPNNGNYQPYTGPCEVRREGEAIILEGLDISTPYIAISVKGEPSFSFGNKMGALLQAFDTQGRPLPFNVATLRSPRTLPFTEGHFLFDYPIDNTDGNEQFYWLDGDKAFAFARGWEKHLGGALCEAYPQVRAYWLELVQRTLDAGVDGVDVRIVNHNRAFDWQVFGRNAPLVEAFQQRYGVDIRTEPFDPALLRQLRGEFYSGWLRQASQTVRSAGRRMQAHVSERMGDPSWRTEMQVHFDWPGWIREGLLDEITLKMYSSVNHRAPTVVNAAREAGVKTHFCPYLNGTHDRPYGPYKVANALADALEGGTDGLILYENYEFMRANDKGGVDLRAPWILEAAAKHARR